MAMPAAAWDLGGRVALITGAGRGIGAGLAEQLARRGMRLALVDLDEASLHETAQRCGDLAEPFVADVSDLESLMATVEATLSRFGSLDVAVANAGVASSGPILDVDPDAFDRTIDINLLGVWRTARATLPAIVRRRGYFVAVASLAAFAHAPMMGAYAASKAGVFAFCNTIRLEMRRHGVDVGAACFGFVRSSMVAESERRKAFQELLATFPSPVGKVLPVEGAVNALVSGIEHRRRMIAYPRWVSVASLFPRLLNMPELSGRTLRALPDLERQWREEAAATDALEASVPPGAPSIPFRRR
jgi:NAD(P)-dependent dehydrogenase (short-subunit alcohol dehydrogenase family)